MVTISRNQHSAAKRRRCIVTAMTTTVVAAIGVAALNVAWVPGWNGARSIAASRAKARASHYAGALVVRPATAPVEDPGAATGSGERGRPLPDAEKSPKKYGKLIKILIDALLNYPGLPKDGGSRFPEQLVKLGAAWSHKKPWATENHYIFLVSEEFTEPYGWSIINERQDSWYIKYVWIAPPQRKLGLGRYILNYIESTCQYPPTQKWGAPDELRLLSGGVDDFYNKLGYRTMKTGSMYLRDDPRTHVDQACTHMKYLQGVTVPEFRDFHAMATHCRNGFDHDNDFITHIVPIPNTHMKEVRRVRAEREAEAKKAAR